MSVGWTIPLSVFKTCLYENEKFTIKINEVQGKRSARSLYKKWWQKNKKHNKNTTKERKEHFRSSLEKRAISCSYNKYYIRNKALLIKHF